MFQKMLQCGSGGETKVYMGIVTLTGNITRINCGFKPTSIMLLAGGNTSNPTRGTYEIFSMYKENERNESWQSDADSSHWTDISGISDITDDGFTFNTRWSTFTSGNIYILAVG